MKSLKLTESMQEKVNIYQQIVNNFLELGDYTQAIENQIMVYNMTKILANDGIEDDYESSEETDQTIQALYSLTQIKFQVIEQQVQSANEAEDTSVIDVDFLIETKNNLEVLIERMGILYGHQNACAREDYESAERMQQEINNLIQ